MKESLSSSRILTFDILRGYFLFVIIVDHLTRSFGFWEIFTGRGAQWVSAAEGFFFVSGVMIGMIRGIKMLSRPFREVLRKCWSRAATLYLWAVGMTIFFSIVALGFAQNNGLKTGYFDGGLSDFLVKTLTLQFSYGWGDFLSFYAVYLFLAPLAIFLLRKKLWHTVLLMSLIVWMQTTTMMGGWQIIFFSGVVAGFHKEQIEGFFLGLRSSTKLLLASTVYLLTAVTLILSVFFTTIAEEYGKNGDGELLGISLASAAEYSITTLRPIFNKVAMEPARLALFYLWFTAMYLLVRKFEEPIKEKLGWFLITLGQNSLYVYIVSAFLLFFMNLAIPLGQPWPINIIISTAFLALVWFMTKREFLFRFIPR